MLVMYYIFLSIFLIYACGATIITVRVKEKNEIVLYSVFLFALSLLFAIRPSVVPDFSSYQRIFFSINPSINYQPNLLKREPTTDTEYGFVGLVLLFKYIFGENYRLFLFLIAIISLHISTVYIKKIVLLIEPNSKISSTIILLLFFPYYGMYYQGIAIRGGIAVMFIIITLYYYIQKRYIFAFGAMFLGFIVQRMTILAILVCFIYRYFPAFKKKTYHFISLLMIVAAIACNVTQGKILLPIYELMSVILTKIFTVIDYSGYLSRADISRIVDKKRLFVLFVFAGLLFFIQEQEIAVKKLLNLVLVSSLLIFATLSITGSERIYDLFSCFSVVVLAIEMSKINTKFPKWSIHLFSIMYMLANFVIAVRIWMYPHA